MSKEEDRQRLKNLFLCKMYATDEEIEEMFPFLIKMLFVIVVLTMIVLYAFGVRDQNIIKANHDSFINSISNKPTIQLEKQ